MKKNITISIGLIVIVLLVIVLAKKQVSAPLVTEDSHQNEIEIPENESVSECGLTVDTPLYNSEISFPLSVTATVDNTNAIQLGCSWTIFEAVAGTTVLKDENGNTIATGHLDTGEEWMTTGPVHFSGTLVPATTPTSGTVLTLVVTEEDPSDGEGGPVSEIIIPLTVQ